MQETGIKVTTPSLFLLRIQGLAENRGFVKRFHIGETYREGDETRIIYQQTIIKPSHVWPETNKTPID